MKKTLLLTVGAMFIVAGNADGQKLKEDYITWPSSSSLHNYVSAWKGGAGTIMVNGVEWEDEEFFISRVKPRQRFINRASQVYSTHTDETDKRSLWWVPIGNHDPSGGLHTNALPNGQMDEEVFSMWSYLDHYGDWTSPFGWCPAALADVAHKNGVAVSGVASIPNSAIPSDWSSCFINLTAMDAATVGKFLLYHGVDGLGYNSEFSSTASIVRGLYTMHANLNAYMADKNSIWEVLWYGGTTDSGSIAFDHGVGSTGGNTNLFNSASIFLNYNWNSTSMIERSIAHAKNVGRNPFYIYAGMNQQGGEPRSGNNYNLLKDYQYSIGVWGAHDYNMFWQSRNDKGSSTEAMQRTYLNMCEQWFGNGNRNPAMKQDIKLNRTHRPTDDWAGLSSMLSARSSIKWAIADEPFYTFFNLGNGSFFNWKGTRISSNEWYSLGLQDYLPTWRWWFAPTFMQTDVEKGTTGLSADFVWEDAYVGGSCLQIAGTSSDEYLHLFKTDLALNAGNQLVLRYKLLEGAADVDIVLANGNNPKVMADGCSFTVLSAADAATEQDKSYDEGWQSKTFVLSQAQYNALNADNGNLGVIALRFRNAKDMKLLLGEFGIYESESAQLTTPAAPEIVKTRVLSNNYAGVDAKVIWKMANNKAEGEPCYNSDVNASMFKVYAQEEGGEVEFVGATTSWAAIAFRATNTDSSKKIRFGVSAVSVDTKTESTISWGSYLEKGAYVASNDIALNKATIKPDESFKVYYVDANHASSTWTLVDAEGNTVAQSSGVELDMPSGLSEIGGYDLYLDRGTAKERRFGYYVQISSEAVGATPEIYSIARDGNTVDESSADVEITLADSPALSYTGRKANGSASRCMALNSAYVGASVADLGLKSNESFSIAGWFKFDAIPSKSWNFMNVSNKATYWPQNTWGWCWNHGDEEGNIFCTFRGNASDSGSPGELHYEFPDTKIQPNVWTHIAYVCEYSSSGFRLVLYINGVKQKAEWFQYRIGNSGSLKYSDMTTDDWCAGQTYGISASDDVYFGGAAYQGAAIDGVVDDFQVWNKAMTVEDVKLSMSGFDPDALPAELLTLWNFENEPAADNSFAAIGSAAGTKGYSYVWEGDPQNGNLQRVYMQPVLSPGCPFLSGTAYPVITEANWADTDRRTHFTVKESTSQDEAGAADVKFGKAGDHTVTLTLTNTYGSDSRTYPVFVVKADAAIDAIGADDAAGVAAYTVDGTLFLEFAADGAYGIKVYNTSGMLVADKDANVAAGQTARISLGSAGVYLVQVVKDGQQLRTIKVVNR